MFDPSSECDGSITFIDMVLSNIYRRNFAADLLVISVVSEIRGLISGGDKFPPAPWEVMLYLLYTILWGIGGTP